MSYKLSREEVEEVLRAKLQECEGHTYFDGVIVSIKPTRDPYDHIFARGDMTKVMEMTSKLVAFTVDCVKEVNPEMQDRDIVYEIVRRALASRMVSGKKILTKDDS